MKTKILTILSLAVLLTFACKKKADDPVDDPAPTPAPATPAAKDTTRPVITLIGADSSVIALNSAYTDPGATAIDNKDGNITAAIVVTGSVNKDLTGRYVMNYNVKDSANNKAFEKKRVVIVANESDYLSGQYTSNPNCGATPTGGGTIAINASTTANKELAFTGTIPGNYTGISPKITVSGNNITIPLVTSGVNSFVGNGTIASDKKSITLSYTATSSSPTTGTMQCTTVFTKQ